MHLDLLPCRHARWHGHHNLLPGMVDEELLTRLDARRHLYAKERHAPHKWVGCACRLASRLRVAAVCGNARSWFQAVPNFGATSRRKPRTAS